MSELIGKNSRPLSPHLSIYKPQISSVLSALHRLSGIYLYIGFLLIAWGICFVVYEDQLYSDKILDCMLYCISNNVICWVLLYVMFCSWLLALYYHTFNGVRYLFWSIGKGLDLKCMHMTGFMVLLCSAVALFLSLVFFILL